MGQGSNFVGGRGFRCICCSRKPDGTVTHRGPDGRPDQWEYRIDRDTYKIAIDTNGDGRPDVVKTYKENQVDEIEIDRNLDGKTDVGHADSHVDLIHAIDDDG